MTKWIDVTSIPLSELLDGNVAKDDQIITVTIGKLRELRAESKRQGAKSFRNAVLDAMPKDMRYNRQIISNTSVDLL